MMNLHQALRFTIAIAIAVLIPAAVSFAAPDTPTADSIKLPERVTFNAHIRPIMSNTCFACHGPDEKANESGYHIDSFEKAIAALPSDDDLVGIKPGDPESSEVYLRITGQSDGEVMPPEDFLHRLTDYDKALFRRWIEQGAQYEQHWSYAPIRKAELPKVDERANEITSPVDAFILDRLAREGIEPSPIADKRTLIRRLSLDLTGLPPTRKQVEAFIADESPDAYSQLVERLLASKHFGERMASSWLDVVRFADTVGFHGDQIMRTFPYRDYVINAFNTNKPFDQFTREQIAGDLLPNATPEQLTATGLLRLNMVTREGGAQPKEYLAKYKADRVRMIGTAWLGTTLACCECHNHKYDPFTTKDFYSIGAFFDDLQQWGVYSDYGYTKNPDLQGFNNDYPFPPEMRVESESLKHEIAALRQERDQRLGKALATAGKGKQDLSEAAIAEWVEASRNHLTRHPDGWIPLHVDSVQPTKSTTATVLEDQSILLQGDSAKDEKIAITSSVDHAVLVNSIRVEVIPDERHGGHVGRSKNGRFELSLEAAVQPAEQDAAKPRPVRPRYVRVELPGKGKILSLAEVEVIGQQDDKPTNFALVGTATQSSLHPMGEAIKAIDGNTDGEWFRSFSVTHTKQTDNPWWEVDLGAERKVDKIVVWNRLDGDYAKRLNGLQVTGLDAQRRVLFTSHPALPSPSSTVSVPETATRQSSTPLEFALVQADRQNPRKYSSGHEPLSVVMPWRSGPAVHQLPRDETKLQHTAVFHLKTPLQLEPGMRLEVDVISSDVGRVGLSVTPFADAIAGWPAADEKLVDAVNAERDGRTELQHYVLRSAMHRATQPEGGLHELAKYYREQILLARSALALTLIAQSINDELIPVSRILPRGNWQDESGELAPPNTPGFLPKSGKTTSEQRSRLDLADWLVDKDNPLVARHFVNRMWKHFFGTGLSAKLDDLGNQGEWPSHPLLLDWLAAEFKDNGWNVKNLVRHIVSSRTYRQQAAVRDDLAEIDPFNRLLSQQSARRLEAEIVRDNALAIAGLLDTSYIGGPSVFPYQPAGHYSNLQFPNRVYEASEDFRQYRRGVYMHWQRTFLHPMLVNFDAPSRDECTADRTASNSPQQALTLLNDPSFVEASIAMAVRLDREKVDADFEQRLQAAFELALARPATSREAESLRPLYEQQLKYYADHLTEASELFNTGLSDPQPAPSNQPSVAAWSQVCRVILNLHETITRY